MIAIDTGVLIRLFVDDGRDHTKDALKAAQRLLRHERLFVPITVLLEAEWALRSVYGFAKESITEAFLKLLGLETVEVEDSNCAEMALRWCASGLDFADALHVARSRHASTFITFDKDLIRRSRRIDAGIVVKPPQ